MTGAGTEPLPAWGDLGKRPPRDPAHMGTGAPLAPSPTTAPGEQRALFKNTLMYMCGEGTVTFMGWGGQGPVFSSGEQRRGRGAGGSRGGPGDAVTPRSSLPLHQGPPGPSSQKSTRTRREEPCVPHVPVLGGVTEAQTPRAGESGGRRWSSRGCWVQEDVAVPGGPGAGLPPPVLLRWPRGGPGLTGCAPGGPASRPP